MKTLHIAPGARRRRRLATERRIIRDMRADQRSEEDIALVVRLFHPPATIVPPVERHATGRKVRAPWTEEEIQVVQGWKGTRVALARQVGRPVSSLYLLLSRLRG